MGTGQSVEQSERKQHLSIKLAYVGVVHGTPAKITTVTSKITDHRL